MSESHIEDVFAQILPEVDNGVFKITFTGWVVAFSSSLVLLDSLCSSYVVVPKVVLTALHTLFFISIAVHLTDFVMWDTTLSVEAVCVLGNNVLEKALVH